MYKHKKILRFLSYYIYMYTYDVYRELKSFSKNEREKEIEKERLTENRKGSQIK